MISNAHKELLTIHGVLIPTQWDKRGQIIQVALQTDSFEKFIIDEDTSPQLLQLLDQHVRVEAMLLSEDLFGHKIIKISHLLNADEKINKQEETMS